MEAQSLSLNPRRAQLRALVVDDVEVNRYILRGFLKAEGIAVHEAASAAEALSMLQRSSFDLVVLDLELGPGADGFLVLDVIRRRRELDLVPVILMSGRCTDSLSVERGLLAGADDYVTRPVAPEVLRARILSAVRSRARLLGLHRDAAAAARSAANALELLREASEVQRSTLPSVPLELRRVAVSGTVVPAQAVAGDAFDVVVDRHGSVAICLYDAAGHGPASGLVVSAARQVVRSVLEHGHDLQAVSDELDRCLSTHIGCVEAAVALGVVRFHSKDGQVEVLNAGLPPISRHCPTRGAELFPSTSLPVGLARSGACQVRRVEAVANSTWLLLSDGVTGGELDEDPVLNAAERIGLAANGERLARSDSGVLDRLVGELCSSALGSRDDASLVLAHVIGSSPE